MTVEQHLFENLVQVVARLRAPGGCAWDRRQTPASLKPYLVEELYEVLEAIEDGDPGHLCEELGDLLLHIVFQAQMASEQGTFDIDDVVRGIRDKMVRRHPHVFIQGTNTPEEQVSVDWERSKREDRRGRHTHASILDGVPRAMPALLRAARLAERASRVGFDWPSIEGVWKKLEEELHELRRAAAHGTQAEVRHELGDVLFTVVNLARFLRVDAEDALRRANSRFVARFRELERGLECEGMKPEDVDLEELDRRWEKAKLRVREETPDD